MSNTIENSHGEPIGREHELDFQQLCELVDLSIPIANITDILAYNNKYQLTPLLPRFDWLTYEFKCIKTLCIKTDQLIHVAPSDTVPMELSTRLHLFLTISYLGLMVLNRKQNGWIYSRHFHQRLI